ncbi:MAG: hypothetical protein PHT88_05155 [Candidatus Moranbacteria bacterium]|nr:hypothetical protein [Candidatus Moranbacteria bacterium]
MKIGIDLDDVLCDYATAFVKYHNDTYSTTLTKADIWSYNFWDVLNISREEAVKRVYAFGRSSKMMDIDPVPGAKRAVDSLLARNHELSLITARDADFSDITHHWLARHFPGVFSDIHFVNHYSTTTAPRSKGDVCREIGASMMIDDSFDNAISCHGVCGSGVLLFDAPWNANKELPVGVHRVFSWYDVLEKLT